MKTPKTASTRLILPRGVAGSEPANADEGTLSFDPTTGFVRVQTSGGWTTVGAGAGGPPTGAAGGDLGSTYPNPTVVQARGLKTVSGVVSVSAATAPMTGQALVATSGTTATWQTLSTAPSGSAGGDLGGTYPNPTVTQARGLKSATTTVDVSSATAPTSGQALVATSSTAATWQTLSTTPSGSAGGDLGGTYPNPTVTQARGLKSASTTVDVSSATAPTSGQALVATSGTAATWQTLSTTPSGAASGDLSGTYPGPFVTQARGLKSFTTTVDVSAAAAPTSGQVLTATGGSAATWQTVTAAPSGSAGGDLGGTYPNPTVTQARGLKSASTTVDVASATAPTSGQVLTATGGSAATWQTPSSTPTGSAGGDLGGTYPNPTVTQTRGLKSASTTVDVASATAPISGQVLTATGGSAATWQTPSSSPTGSAGGDLGGTYPNPTVTQARGLKSATTTVDVSSATAPSLGQALVATGSTAATWQTLTSLVSNRDPFWDAPTTASTEDDEFTSDTLASGAWTVSTDGTFTGYTRDGGIQPNTTVPAGHYRSDCIGSTVLVQVPANTSIAIYKRLNASLAGTKQWWWCSIGFTSDFLSPGNANAGMQLWNNNSGIPDSANRYATRSVSNGGTEAVSFSCRKANSVVVNDLQNMPYYAANGCYMIYAVHNSSSGDTGYGYTWSREGSVFRVSGATGVTNALPVLAQGWYGFVLFAAFDMFRGDNSSAGSPIFALNFIRRRERTGSNWLAAP